MTTQADRLAAAGFYLRTHTGAIQSWIDSNVDEEDRVDEDIKALAVLLAEVRASGAAAERKLHPADASTTTLIEALDGVSKKLSAAQDEIAALQLLSVTPKP